MIPRDRKGYPHQTGKDMHPKSLEGDHKAKPIWPSMGRTGTFALDGQKDWCIMTE